MNQRLTYIDSLRVIATIMVIFIHVSSLFLSAQQSEAGDEGLFAYQFVNCFSLCAVAIFVMISGGLLLSKDASMSYTRVFQRYIPRILWALVIFALPMCFIEQLITNRGASTMDILTSSMLNFLTGHSWTHMWYLYMLPGLYLVTPLLHTFMLSTTRKEHTQLLLALITMGIVIPNISMLTGIDMHSYMTLPSFIATYVLGAYILRYCPDNRKTLLCATLCLVAYTVYSVYATTCQQQAVGPEFILSIAVSAALLCIIRHRALLPSLCKRLAPHCFCIYIIHPVFLNVMFRILHVGRTLHFHPVGNMLIVVATVFALSLLTSHLLRLVPFMRSRVL